MKHFKCGFLWARVLAEKCTSLELCYCALRIRVASDVNLFKTLFIDNYLRLLLNTWFLSTNLLVVLDSCSFPRKRNLQINAKQLTVHIKPNLCINKKIFLPTSNKATLYRLNQLKTQSCYNKYMLK